MEMKTKVIVAILFLIPKFSFAEVTTIPRIISEVTVENESCNKDLKALIANYCKHSKVESLKEIFTDSFRMRTNAEDTLEEWFTYSGSIGNTYSIKRYTDFNDQREYGDYCFISLTCLE